MQRSFISWGLALTLFALTGRPTHALALDAKSKEALQNSWAEAVRALSRENYPEALEQFSRWQNEARDLGVESPELHYNLGIVHLNLKQTGPAAFHLLESARLSTSPLRVWKTLEALSQIQRGIGVKDNIVDTPNFRFAFLVGSNLMWGFLALAFWCFIATALISWWTARFPLSARILVLAGLVTGAVAGASWFNRQYLLRPAVLVATAASTVNVYSAPTAKKESLLVELPQGTVINVASVRGEMEQIDSPVAGWIESKEARPVWP